MEKQKNNEKELDYSMQNSLVNIVDTVSNAVDKNVLQCSSASFEQKYEMIYRLREMLNHSLDTSRKRIDNECELCPDCKIYYKRNVFEEVKTKEKRHICVFRGLGEWDDDEYEDKDCIVLYHICPRGHKIEKNVSW